MHDCVSYDYVSYGYGSYDYVSYGYADYDFASYCFDNLSLQFIDKKIVIYILFFTDSTQNTDRMMS